MKRGFTLIEMLVVLGIIVILSGILLSSYSYATKRAQAARGRELVSNVATALTELYQKKNFWPPALRAAAGNRQLDANAAKVLAVNNLLSLSYDKKSGKLVGQDRFGIVDPWALDAIKSSKSASENLRVPSGKTVKDHILYFAIDTEGRGITEAKVGGVQVNVRAPVVVWSAGMDGVEQPYPFGKGHTEKGGQTAAKSKIGDDIYSWSPAQVEMQK